MSLRLVWLCEWPTLVPPTQTPLTANSCADPVRLRSLPRRLLTAAWLQPAATAPNPDRLGAALVELFFFPGPPNPKNLGIYNIRIINKSYLNVLFYSQVIKQVFGGIQFLMLWCRTCYVGTNLLETEYVWCIY